MRILLADDHQLVREGLKPFLEELDSGVSFLDAGSLDEVLVLVPEAGGIDLILLDLFMPGMRGLSGVSRVVEAFPGVPVVVLSGHVQREDIMEAMNAGAAGYIPKTTNCAALLNALRLVLSGEKYLPSSVLAEDEAAATSAAFAGQSKLRKLSEREIQILGMVVQGNTNKEIARRLGLEEITVKVHLRNIYRKIGAANRAQAVRVAMECGLGPR